MTELAEESAEMFVVSEDDLAKGNGDGVLGTVEHVDQQWLPENDHFLSDLLHNMMETGDIICKCHTFF